MTHSRRVKPVLFTVLFATLTTLLIALAPRTPASATGAQPGAPSGVALNLSLETFVAPGLLEAPVDITHAGDERLFVVERQGRVRIVRPDGSVDPAPFLDIDDRVTPLVGERGLLGLVFHPDYAENGYFFVNYTAEPDGRTRISRFSVTNDPDVADPGSEQIVLEVAQPATNHNAGDLLFGPQDGYLYIPLGDGGGSNDPQNRAQAMTTLLGKLVRIDVDQGPGSAPDCGAPGAYTIPDDNPFLDGAGGDCDEIWALGLRNPWRASFDRQTGDLYMGDVGQSGREEIDRQDVASAGGENYGWSCYEGTRLNTETHMESCDDASAYDMPIFEIPHEQDGVCAITGGYVYRGPRYPEMQGRYLFSDLCAPYIWDLENVGGNWQGVRHDNMQTLLGGIVSFGEDIYGELYLTRINDGAVYRLIEDTVPDGDLWLPMIFR